MIKASARNGAEPLIIMGLTSDNVRRLKAGQPISVAIRSFGIDQPGQILITYGETEQAIADEFKKQGLITEQTKVHRDEKLDAQAAVPRKYEKLLIATVGLPRSGKTTWAKSQAYPIVSPDAIRYAIHGQRFIGQAEPFVWATAKAMVQALFIAGHNTVILDACNNIRKRRDEWGFGDWDLVFKVIDTDANACLERAYKEDDQYIVSVIERMASSSESLQDDELRWP